MPVPAPAIAPALELKLEPAPVADPAPPAEPARAAEVAPVAALVVEPIVIPAIGTEPLPQAEPVPPTTTVIEQIAPENLGTEPLPINEPPRGVETLDVDETVVDPAVVAELLDMRNKDGVPLLHELIDLFLKNSPNHLSQITSAGNNPTKLVFAAHVFRGMSLNLGANRLGEICLQIENLGNSGNLSALEGLLPELDGAYQVTCRQFIKLRNSSV